MLEYLKKELDSATKESYEVADRMYSKAFRSEPFLDDGKLVVAILNYKGEMDDDDYVNFNQYKHLPVFKNKVSSWDDCI